MFYLSMFDSALRRVIGLYSGFPLPPLPRNIEKRGYGPIQLHKTTFLFDLLDLVNPADLTESQNPVSMESAGQVNSASRLALRV